MTTRAPFLTRSYGGYYHRDLPPEDDVLTHVGPGTPCGEYLRRFWNPVVFLDELNDLPVRVRVMGEDLVVFKDRQGQVGRAATPLLPPRDLFGVRGGIRAGPTLLLPRLALRCRRPGAGDAG